MMSLKGLMNSSSVVECDAFSVGGFFALFQRSKRPLAIKCFAFSDGAAKAEIKFH